MLKIKVIVKGGVVQSVYSSQKECEVEILDFDVDDSLDLSLLEDDLNDIETSGEFTAVY